MEVNAAFQHQKSRAPSVSGLSPHDLKSICTSIAKPLSTIFTHFLMSSSFFLDWLRSSVFFIYKGKGARDDPNNHRSICIQDPFAKVFSTILTKRLSSYAENNDLLPKFQFGFRSNRSTTAAASLLYEVAYSRLENRKRTYVAFVDFKKAFDRVRRPLLFQKLQLLGVPLRFCQILDFIFKSTKYFIKSGDFFTNHFHSNIGVPQGDPISPILFNLFISDLPLSLTHGGVYLNGIQINYIQYADDLCLLGNSAEDLQHGLNDLKQYCDKNFIEINTTKTKIQIYHRGRLPPCEFHLNEEIIEIVNDFCYLGFNLSVQLSFSQHGRNINSKARAKCGLLFTKLPLQNLPLDIVLELFKVFILPSYSYGLALWSSNCSNSVFQSINATFSKYLKRYLQIPTHSNNAIVHFLTSTTPLSETLKNLAPHTMGSFTFPTEMHGHKLSFLQHENGNHESANVLESIPTEFWLSRNLHSIPARQNLRKSLCRDVLDSDHFLICKTPTFHPTATYSCICKLCNNHAHMFHHRYCNVLNANEDLSGRE